jgi:hypothetical protein
MARTRPANAVTGGNQPKKALAAKAARKAAPGPAKKPKRRFKPGSMLSQLLITV